MFNSQRGIDVTEHNTIIDLLESTVGLAPHIDHVTSINISTVARLGEYNLHHVSKSIKFSAVLAKNGNQDELIKQLHRMVKNIFLDYYIFEAKISTSLKENSDGEVYLTVELFCS